MIKPDVSCPSGGTFYACGDGSRFVGCCNSNPCSVTGCAAGNLEPVTFNINQYGQIPDQECSAGQFYTCSYTKPPFWGCCESNPCATTTGCPASDLAGAYLSNNPSTTDPFLRLNDTYSAPDLSSSTSVSSTTSSTFSSTSAGKATAATAAASASASSLPTPSVHDSINVGAIAGGVVGGLAVLAAFILGILFLLRRRKRTEHLLEQGNFEICSRPKEPMTPDNKIIPGNVRPYSPTVAGSPQPPYSPGPPSYSTNTPVRHVSYELPVDTEQELDSGQRYHPYRPEQASYYG